MTASKGTSARPAARDDLDDVFGDDDEDFYRDLTPPRPAAPVTAEFVSRNNRGADGLGIEEEVEVKQKLRAPRVKLDENRLLSDAGIQKLRRTAKDKLKFKGRGHEFSDCARLLSFYQLWLDGLFPKAKFADALAMVEKLGHKKTIQRKRSEWIDEGKPQSSVREGSPLNDAPVPAPREREKSQRIAPTFEPRPSDRPKTPPVAAEDDEEEDIYGVSPFPKKTSAAVPVRSVSGGGEDDIPDGDDLDALLGGENDISPGQPNDLREHTDISEDDDLDALLGRSGTSINKKIMKSVEPAPREDLDSLFVEGRTNKPPSKPTTSKRQVDFEDEEEAMAAMDMEW